MEAYLLRREVENFYSIYSNRKCPGFLLSVCSFSSKSCTFEEGEKCPLFEEVKKKVLSFFQKNPKISFCPLLVLKGFPLEVSDCDCKKTRKKFSIFPCWEIESGEMISCRVRNLARKRKEIEVSLKKELNL